MKKINVAVIGLRFGGSFPPIYLEHPDVDRVAICDADESLLQSYGDKYRIEERFRSLEDVLAARDFDAVHILTGIPTHAEMTLAVLKAGRHCACTVPMATSVADLHAIVAAQRASRKNYMMMETAVYTYHFLHAQKMHQRGEFGRIQFLRGAHYQDMECWPDYWMGLPPMWYATHAIAPLLALAGARASRVHCFGSGQMREELHRPYKNPYPVETAIFRLSGEGLAAEVTRSLFETAHEYVESFHVYGEKKSFEWHIEHELPVVTDMKPAANPRQLHAHDITVERVSPGDQRDLLPESIRHSTELHIIPDPQNPHQSLRQGGGHHGSHPHLVHEFVRSIVEERAPWIDAVTAANWTAAGLCAHESAMRAGAEVVVPEFGPSAIA
jgi:predicted dehydrogenase